MTIDARSVGVNHLDDATRLLAVVELELETKGYHTPLVKAALARARGMAQCKARPISPNIRDKAFYDLLVDELRDVETWIHQQQQSVVSQQ